MYRSTHPHALILIVMLDTKYILYDAHTVCNSV